MHLTRSLRHTVLGAALAILLVQALATGLMIERGRQEAIVQANQTVERIGFYDQAWGIDPIANALPESEGILLDDRCGSGVSRLYPWFGGGQQRTVARVDCDGTTAQQILKLMKREGLSYVELVIPLQDRAARALLYPPESFTLVSESTRQTDKVTLDRVLYRWNDAPPPKVKPSPLSAPPT